MSGGVSEVSPGSGCGWWAVSGCWLSEGSEPTLHGDKVQSSELIRMGGCCNQLSVVDLPFSPPSTSPCPPRPRTQVWSRGTLHDCLTYQVTALTTHQMGGTSGLARPDPGRLPSQCVPWAVIDLVLCVCVCVVCVCVCVCVCVVCWLTHNPPDYRIRL